MKRLLFISVFSAIIAVNMYGKTYYISTAGSNTNSGVTESLAWKTVTYAAGSSSPVAAGDTVYVRAGNYGAEKVVFQKSGTVGAPISFIGYKVVPGDAPPLLVDAANPYAAFLSIDMPLFDGGNRANGTGFDCLNKKYLTLKNFQIQNYAYGLIAGGSTQVAGNLSLYNINTMYLGDIKASYSGYGFMFGSMGTKFSNNNILENCMAVNAAAEGFGINGDNNILKGCKAYCNENTSAASTDYYIILCGSYNTVKSCFIERAAGLSHNGHGISVKSNAEQVVDKGLSVPVINPQYNKILYCVAKNMGESFCVRHRGVQYNLFYHCKAIGSYTSAGGSTAGEGNCIVNRDGASNNTFDGCIAENCLSAFRFEDTIEDGDTGTNPTGHPGNNNKYINCLVYNCYIGVKFDAYSIQSDAGDNTIANCTFYKTKYMYSADRHCANIKNIGNIYYGGPPSSDRGGFKTGPYSADIIPNGADTYFKSCNFFNIEGGMPANFVTSSIGSISADPLFVNADILDFHLALASPCKDASIAQAYVLNDFDEVPRSQGAGVDIGAYECKTGETSFSATVSSSNVRCNGGNNGSGGVAVSGGKPPYTYLWNNGQTTASVSGLRAGNYFVTVSDANLSSKTYTVINTEPLVITNTITSISNVSRAGESDGQITIASEGGTPAYTYLWLPSRQTTAMATGLSAGDHLLTATDANSCTTTRTIAITQPVSTTVSAKIYSRNVSCNEGSNGSATVMAGGGNPPYIYLWSNDQTTATASGLIAGNYSVTVTDGNLSSKTYAVSITEPQVNINTITSISNVSDAEESDGQITIISEGGTPGYTYLWLPSGQTTTMATGLAAGDHRLIVTDANACVAGRTITITEPFSATVYSSNVSCNAGNNGSATLIASGGKSPYTYLWNNGQTTATVSGLIAGNYFVTVRDKNLNSETHAVSITEPQPTINTITSISNVSHAGESDGQITIASEGGTPAYTYLWLPSNQTTGMATGLSAGDHLLIVTDANACVTTRTISITPSDVNFSLNVSPAPDPSVFYTTAVNQSQEENRFTVFPNPTAGLLTMAFSDQQIGNEILVAVRDLLGKEFYSKMFIISNAAEVIKIDCGFLTKGVYTIVAATGNISFEKKIIIQ